jgi:hypothetical protein
MSGSGYHGEMAPAKHSIKRREMWSLLADLDQNEEFWPSIIERISDGDFISEIAKSCNVTHSILRNWIRGNKARDAAYIAAELHGRKARAERVLQKTFETAVADIEAPPTRMEALRAAEIMLKQRDAEQSPRQQFGDINITFVAAKDGRPAEKVIEHVD